MKQKFISLITLAIITLGACFANLCSAADVSAKEVRFNAADYNYGRYVVSARGVGYEGVYDEDVVAFWYLPVYPEIVLDESTGEYYADLEYEPDDGTKDCNGDVVTVEINIYDSDGNLLTDVSPVVVNQPDKTARLSLPDHGVPSGTYTAEVIAYDENGNLLYEPYYVEFEYEAIAVPNTGKFFQNLNISKEDYLVTGLIVFFVLGVVAFGVITKSGKRTTGSRKRR